MSCHTALSSHHCLLQQTWCCLLWLRYGVKVQPQQGCSVNSHRSQVEFHVNMSTLPMPPTLSMLPMLVMLPMTTCTTMAARTHTLNHQSESCAFLPEAAVFVNPFHPCALLSARHHYVYTQEPHLQPITLLSPSPPPMSRQDVFTKTQPLHVYEQLAQRLQLMPFKVNLQRIYINHSIDRRLILLSTLALSTIIHAAICHQGHGQHGCLNPEGT